MNKYQFSKDAQRALEGLQQAFAIYQFIDKRVVTLVLSDGFLELFGYETREEAITDMDHDMYKDTHPDDVARIEEAAFNFATKDNRYEVVYRTRIKDSNDYKIVHARGKHILTDDGVRLAQVWYMDEGTYSENNASADFEITKTLSNALHEQSMVKQSQYDYLTGLPNMTYFFELAEAAKAAIKSVDHQPVLLYLDFKGMKYYNTKHGFAEGDKMLQEFAAMLKHTFGAENCCRIGSDHFALVTEEEGLDEKLNELFDKWQNACGDNSVPVHVGVYRSRGDGTHVSVAMDRAKLACNSLKDNYSSGFEYYSQELSDEESHRQYIIENIDKAIEEGWIHLYIQPIVRAINGKVCDVEALARWIDPEKGFLSPNDFIPTLEEAGLIYKLDLCMLEKVLDNIKIQTAEGFSIVPHSINLSRSDFDSCDIVEEIRKRVDEAGIKRDRITIEITESIIGKDFEFMKAQIERFQKLGFPVWMDDFGSGYSSLDVLQSIRFDLIKFDMSFMRKLDEGEEGKIILTELMRMATALNLDTVCEGVETESQADFLKEIGCAKLQGYYYSKPIPSDEVIAKHSSNELIKTENLGESNYYENIGKVNLFDLNVISSVDDKNALHNTFSSIPIAILEVKDGHVGYIRCNRSYQDFAKRFLDLDIMKWEGDINNPSDKYDPAFISAVRRSCTNDAPIFFNEKMPDGSVSHSFVRRIGKNLLNNASAIVVAILSISEPSEVATFADIASSLASDYYNIYVINLDTNDYIEYSSKVGNEEMSLERHGGDFFESAKRDTMTRIYEDDREHFLSIFTKENVLKEIEQQGVFTTTYRLIDTGKPTYVNMKITRMNNGNRLILGVSIIDAHMKQLEEERKLRQEKLSLGRIAALSPNYIVLYIIDPLTNHYTQYNPSDEFADLKLATQGIDFFKDVINDAPKVMAPEDMENHLRIMSKENVLSEIRNKGTLVYNYRFLLNGRFVPATLRAAMVQERDGEKIILGVTSDEEEYNRRLEEAYKKASSDAVIYNHVAHALARGLTDLYYVNTETSDFVAFNTDDESGVLSEARRGTDFFEQTRKEAGYYIHPDDMNEYLKTLDHDFLNEIFNHVKEYELVYRRIDSGTPLYVKIRISRMEDDKRFLVMAIEDVDELIRQRKAEERIQEERIVYARLHALTGNFIVVYVVDPETGDYREFSSTQDYEEDLAQAKEGTDFFNKVREVARQTNYPEDFDLFMAAFTKDNIMSEIERSGSFSLGYRFVMDGRPVYVQMKAAMVEEKEGPRLIVGLNNIDAQVRQEQEFSKRLAQAQIEAKVDALTGVKNKLAFNAMQQQIDEDIAGQRQQPFAVVMLDLNDLKKINDANGHNAGDQYLKDACNIICKVFAHSPVFRIGGDEFAVISQGTDYERIDELMEEIKKHNENALLNNGVVIACGMSKFNNDSCVNEVLERADRKMYENKASLKAAE